MENGFAAGFREKGAAAGGGRRLAVGGCVDGFRKAANVSVLRDGMNLSFCRLVAGSVGCLKLPEDWSSKLSWTRLKSASSGLVTSDSSSKSAAATTEFGRNASSWRRGCSRKPVKRRGCSRLTAGSGRRLREVVVAGSATSGVLSMGWRARLREEKGRRRRSVEKMSGEVCGPREEGAGRGGSVVVV